MHILFRSNVSAIEVLVSADANTAFFNISFSAVLATTGFIPVFPLPFPNCPDVPVPNPNIVPSVPTTKLWSSPVSIVPILLKYGIFSSGLLILYTSPFSP